MPPRSQVVDRLVGLFIVLPLILVAVLVYGLARQKGWFERWITIRAPFPEGTVVERNTRVTFGVAGDEIGYVKDVVPEERTVQCFMLDKAGRAIPMAEKKTKCTMAALRIRKEFVDKENGIKRDSVASLVKPYFNLFGEAVVNISAGSDGSGHVEDGDVIAMREHGPGEAQEITADSLRDLLANLIRLTDRTNALMDQLTRPDNPAQRILANSDKLLTDLVAAEQRLTELLRDEKVLTQQVNDRIAAAVVQVAKTLREQDAKIPISHEGGELQMRLNPKLQDQVDKLIVMAEKLDKMLTQTMNTENSVSLFLRSPEFYKDTLSLVKETRATMVELMQMLVRLRDADLGTLVKSGQEMMDRGGRILRSVQGSWLVGLPPLPPPGPPMEIEQRYTPRKPPPPPPQPAETTSKDRK